MPGWNRTLLGVAVAMALCTYYLNYGAAFEEGVTEAGGITTIVLRMLAVATFVVALAPHRIPPLSVLLLVTCYLAYAVSFFLSAGLHGSMNDVLFVNTLLQLPVAFAAASSRWPLHHNHWLSVLCGVLTLQVIVDASVWHAGASLWLSQAFIGGVGNPSSFGLLCAIGLAYCTLHPNAGRVRWIFSLFLIVGAIMSKSLFAVLASAIVALVWMAQGWRRMTLGLLVAAATVFVILTLLVGTGDDEGVGFVEHKLSAAGAIVGLIEYDVESSATVSLRIEMHQQTFQAIANQPTRLLIGHLDGQPYWPMDSQLLTYLGSFGLPALLLMMVLHVWWTVCAWRTRRDDGGFAVVSLALFSIVFATNRILDYFPIATVYFMIVAMVTQTRHSSKGQMAPARATAGRGSRRSSAPVPASAERSAPIPVPSGQ